MMRRIALALVVSLVAAAAVRAQQPAGGRLVYDTIHSAALEKNLYGDSPNREVLVYLPPSYATSSDKRYPVIYLLHGYGGTEKGAWLSLAPVKPAMDSLVRNGTVREMIVVMPNALTVLGGSFYMNSRSSGNWDDFIAKELVAFVDKKYRTLARPESRGLAGHSMGGFGTFAVGMRHAGETYGALYALSGCCTQVGRTPQSAVWQAIADVHSVADVKNLAFFPRVSLALASVFSANPSAPPLFVNAPFENKGGTWTVVDSVFRLWQDSSPLPMIPGHAEQLKRLRGFVFDVGTSDQLVAPAALAAMDNELTRVGVTHLYETYDGDHTNRIAVRLAARLLPFFSKTLDFGDASRR
jgi:S-formylglutathione hydrolase